MINFEKNIIFIGDIINIRLFFVEIATFRRSSRPRKILGLIKNVARVPFIGKELKILEGRAVRFKPRLKPAKR